MDTCLFTGEPLGHRNAWEHAIPEKLGGKIVSKRITSTEFNNRSSGLDCALVDQYLGLLVQLRPLLAKHNRLGARYGEAQIDGVTVPVQLEYGGAPTLKRSIVPIAHDEDGQPRTYLVRDKRDEERLAESLRRQGRSVQTERVTPEMGAYTYARNPSEFDWKVEVIALKAGLLVFDELLADTPSKRFTRDPSLTGVRDFVRDVVFSGEDDPRFLPRYDKHVMGFQFDKMPEISVIRHTYVPVPPRDFEHVLIATGNPATRTVDLVWSVAGIDVYGYRLTHSWRSPAFTCIAVCGMLAGETCLRPPVWLERASYVCAKSRYCAAGRGVRKEDYPKLVEEWGKLRDNYLLRAYQTATYRTEVECDDWVASSFARSYNEMGIAGHPFPRPMNIIARKLCRMYYHRLGQVDVRVSVRQWIGRLRDEWDRMPAGKTELHWCEAEPWLLLLPAYREALRDLSARHGSPGHLTVWRKVTLAEDP